MIYVFGSQFVVYGSGRVLLLGEISLPIIAYTASRDIVDGTLLFPFNYDCQIPGRFMFPRSWKIGTQQRPYIVYRCSNDSTGSIKFRFDYKTADIDEDFPVYISLAKTVNAPGSSGTLCLVELDPIEMTGYTLNCITQWRLTRLGTMDTYNGTVKLIAVGTSTEFVSLGTRFEHMNFC